MRIFIAGILTLLLSSPCLASYTVEWGYTPPSAPAVTGYRLYRESEKVADFPGAATESGTVDGEIKIGDSFTLTALFSDSTESPHSAPFIYTRKNPFIKTITIN